MLQKLGESYLLYDYLNNLTRKISQHEIIKTIKGEELVINEITKKNQYIWQSGTVPGSNPTKSYFESTIHEDEEGRKITTYYDKVGNKVAEKIGTNNPTIFNYNGIYQLTSVISPEGKTTRYSYDNLGYLKEKETPDADIYQYRYDKWGNLRFELHYNTAPYQLIFNRYDALNRLVIKGKFATNHKVLDNEQYNPDITYDDNNNPNTSFEDYNNDQDKFLTVNMYDTYTRSGVFASLPYKGATEIEEMNLKGRLTATAFRDEPGGAWSYKIYSYDPLGRVNKYMVKMTSQDWKTIENKYDHIGNLVWQNINNEHYIWNYYDAEGRLAKVKSNRTNNETTAALEVQYNYNNADQIIRIGKSHSLTTLNNITVTDVQHKTDVEIIAENVHVLGVSGAELYLTAGNSITLKPGFKVTEGAKFSTKIDPALAEEDLAYRTIDYQYNNRGWVSSITNKSKSGTARFTESLTYEKNGNIKTQGITNKANPTWANLNFTYTYDAMNRLTASDCQNNNAYDETFSYYQDGNFLRKVSNGKTYNYNYIAGTNKVNTIPGYFSYLYDKKGNIKTKKNKNGTTLFTANKYDYRNLPLQVWNNNSGTTYYNYDDGGNRIHKKVGPGNVTHEYYLRDHTGKEVAIYNKNNNKLNQVNLYGNGMIENIKANWSGGTRTDERYYYVKDHLSSIRMTIDENSEITSGRDYYAYGEELRGYSLAITDKYQFTEKERDSETGFDYFGARYYDSKIGRWLSVDPLADKYPGWSPYNYTLCNPLRFIDPDGNGVIDPFPFFTKVAMALGIMNKEQQSFRDKAKEYRKNGTFPNIPDGPADAWRHVATSKYFAEKYGDLTAKILGVANEGKAVIKGLGKKGEVLDKNINQIKMDLSNNKIGRDLAGQDVDLIKKANEGEFNTLEPTVIKDPYQDKIKKKEDEEKYDYNN